MELPSSIPEVMENAANYFMISGSSIPDFQRQRIVERMGPGVSPVDFIVTVSEALYAAATELDHRGREIAAQAAYLAALNGWHGMSERGNKMVGALKKLNGEDSSQSDDDDPEPLEAYISQEEDVPEPILPPQEDVPSPLQTKEVTREGNRPQEEE